MEIVTKISRLPPRPADANKGTFGKVLVVAGSRGMAGAAVLAGTAALRAGAGLVRIGVPVDIQTTVAAGHPCYTTWALTQDDKGRLHHTAADSILKRAWKYDVLALGPGLGQSEELSRLVPSLLDGLEMPIVLDADGLNAMGTFLPTMSEPKGPRIFTPHPGEFARLLGCDIPTVQNDREGLAEEFAHRHKIVLVLKGHKTVVTDGDRLYINETGNPGMASGGTGDVLTGIIAALMGQMKDAFAAAQLGVYLHGLAGDLARDKVGEVSLLATDIIDSLPQAIQRVHS